MLISHQRVLTQQKDVLHELGTINREIKGIKRGCGGDVTHTTGHIHFQFIPAQSFSPSPHPSPIQSPLLLLPSPRQINFPARPSILPTAPTPTLPFVSRRHLHFQRTSHQFRLSAALHIAQRPQVWPSPHPTYFPSGRPGGHQRSHSDGHTCFIQRAFERVFRHFLVARKKACACMCTVRASGLCDTICTLSRQNAFHPSKSDCSLPLCRTQAYLAKSLKTSCWPSGLNI